MSQARMARIEGVLSRRQPGLTVALENVHKPYNLSAIMRTADAVGCCEVHHVPAPGSGDHEPDPSTAAGAHRWVQAVAHPDVPSCMGALKARGFRVVAAHPDPTAGSPQAVDFTQDTAILMGAELEGLSQEARSLADAVVSIPMQGMVQSLNVSVACAILLYEAERQRRQAGMYELPQLGPAALTRLAFEWAQPEVASFCRKHRVAYPALSAEGHVPSGCWNEGLGD